jgi:hypothetical protein
MLDATLHQADGGIDCPPRPATVEDAEKWLERRRRELAELQIQTPDKLN